MSQHEKQHSRSAEVAAHVQDFYERYPYPRQTCVCRGQFQRRHCHAALLQTSVAPSLSLLLNHDDEKREYAYQAGAEESLKRASQHGWTVVSIKNDWKTVFADQ
jgi:hypothetical protein